MRISDWSSDVCSSDLGAIAIGNDDPGAGGQEAVLLQIADTETGGDRPEVAVAIIEIFRPFEIAAQAGDGDFDLDERDSAIRAERNDNRATAVAERNPAHRTKILVAPIGTRHVLPPVP